MLWGYSPNFVLTEVPVLLKIDVLVEFKISPVNLSSVGFFLIVLNNSKKYTFATEYQISKLSEISARFPRRMKP